MADEQYDWLDGDAAERLLRGEPVNSAAAGDDQARAQAERLSAALRAVRAGGDLGAEGATAPRSTANGASGAGAGAAAAGSGDADGASGGPGAGPADPPAERPVTPFPGAHLTDVQPSGGRLPGAPAFDARTGRDGELPGRDGELTVRDGGLSGPSAAAATAPPGGLPGELPGEAAALAAFRAARASRAAGAPGAAGAAGVAADRGAVRLGRRPGGREHTRWGRPVRFGLAAVLAACTLGGVAVAASTGVLPTPFGGGEDAPGPSSTVSAAPTSPDPLVSPSTGTSEPGQDIAGTGEETPDGRRSPTESGSGRPTHGGQAPDDGVTTAPEQGRPSTGASGDLYDRVVRACRDYRAGKPLDADKQRRLEQAAKSPEDVRRFCDQVLGADREGGRPDSGSDGSGGSGGGDGDHDDGKGGKGDDDRDDDDDGGRGHGGNRPGSHGLIGDPPQQSAPLPSTTPTPTPTPSATSAPTAAPTATATAAPAPTGTKTAG